MLEPEDELPALASTYDLVASSFGSTGVFPTIDPDIVTPLRTVVLAGFI